MTSLFLSHQPLVEPVWMIDQHTEHVVGYDKYPYLDLRFITGNPNYVDEVHRRYFIDLVVRGHLIHKQFVKFTNDMYICYTSPLSPIVRRHMLKHSPQTSYVDCLIRLLLTDSELFLTYLRRNPSWLAHIGYTRSSTCERIANGNISVNDLRGLPSLNNTRVQYYMLERLRNQYVRKEPNVIIKEFAGTFNLVYVIYFLVYGRSLHQIDKRESVNNVFVEHPELIEQLCADVDKLQTIDESHPRSFERLACENLHCDTWYSLTPLVVVFGSLYRLADNELIIQALQHAFECDRGNSTFLHEACLKNRFATLRQTICGGNEKMFQLMHALA